jgi:hypothetical protein
MPSLTVPITSNIKMKNSCRRILTRNALTPPPSSSAETIEAEFKVKINLYFTLFVHISISVSNENRNVAHLNIRFDSRFYKNNFLIEYRQFE